MAGSDEEEHVYTFGPSVKATPQRWRARFDSLYQAEYIAKTAHEVNVTQDDYTKYASVNPAESENLKRMHGASRLTGTVMTTLGGHLVADDIGGWIYGTYKFDIAGTNRKFLEWVVEERKTGRAA